VHELLERLRGSDASDIAGEVVADPPLIAVLLDAMLGGDEGIQARAAAAAEQAARERPELLAPHADALIDAARRAGSSDVRENLAQMLARVELSDERAAEAGHVLDGYLDDPEQRVQAWALSAIVALANEHPQLRAHARELVHERLDGDAPAVSERARLLRDQSESWPSGSAGAS
jgi:HEAT repeat protein